MKKLIPYWVEDGNGNKVEVFVTQEVFNVLDEDRKEKERATKEHQRRGTDYDVEDEYVVFHHWQRHDSLEDCVVYNTEMARLMEFLDEHCTKTLKRRFLMVNFDGYTYEALAALEGVSKPSILKSTKYVEKKIKTYFKKG